MGPDLEADGAVVADLVGRRHGHPRPVGPDLVGHRGPLHHVAPGGVDRQRAVGADGGRGRPAEGYPQRREVGTGVDDIIIFELRAGPVVRLVDAGQDVVGQDLGVGGHAGPPGRGVGADQVVDGAGQGVDAGDDRVGRRADQADGQGRRRGGGAVGADRGAQGEGRARAADLQGVAGAAGDVVGLRARLADVGLEGQGDLAEVDRAGGVGRQQASPFERLGEGTGPAGGRGAAHGCRPGWGRCGRRARRFVEMGPPMPTTYTAAARPRNGSTRRRGIIASHGPICGPSWQPAAASPFPGDRSRG